MKKQPKNLAASVRARLLELSRQNNINFNVVVMRFLQERFLYRLSQSKYKPNLILKGALLFLIHNFPDLRPTKDVDLLGRDLKNKPDFITEVLCKIVSLSVDDGLIFYPDHIQVEEIIEQGKYKGVRAKVPARLDTIRLGLQIDIGFGDSIYPKPVTTKFPVILDFPAPQLSCYSAESALAEKFEAVVKLNFLTSRMKDFYDIYFLAWNYPFKATSLSEACKRTFGKRNTDLKDRFIIFSVNYRNDPLKNEQWKAFLKRNSLNKKIEFNEVLLKIEQFLEPLFSEFDQVKNRNWSSAAWKWI